MTYTGWALLIGSECAAEYWHKIQIIMSRGISVKLYNLVKGPERKLLFLFYIIIEH